MESNNRFAGKVSGTSDELPEWDQKLRQWGIGLMILGLIGLTLPLFGLQLRRLRNLGEAQWMVLCAITFAGSCAFAYAGRRNLLVNCGISAGALVLMCGLALASFGPGLQLGGQPVANRPPDAAAGNSRVPPAAPPKPASQPPRNSTPVQPADSVRDASRDNSEQDPVELTARIVQLLERSRNLLASVVDVPSAERAAGELRLISHQRDEVVKLLQATKPNITPEQNQEIGRRYGTQLEQLGNEVAVQMTRISALPGVEEALHIAAAGERDEKTADPATISSNNARRAAGDSSVVHDAPKAPPTPEFEALPSPSVPLPPVASSIERIRDSALTSSVRGNEFADTAPPSGVLVGLRVIKGADFGGAVQAIQPIYQNERSFTLGQLHGNPGPPAGEPLQVLAPPGWAVGQIQVRQGFVVNAVRLVFRPIRGKGLDVEQSKESEWLGGNGGSETSLGAPGAFIVGLSGSYEKLLSALRVHQLQPELEPPQIPFPPLAYAQNRIEPSAYLGSNSGTEFRDVAPEGGILVGMILSQGPNWGGALQAVQPIYQVQDRYELGQRYGSPGGTEVPVLARPGYAIGGVRIRSGLVLNAMQLVFMRFEGKQLNPRDTYNSSWVGSDGGGPAEMLGKGQALAGVFGKYQEDLHGIGVGVVRQLRVSAAVSAADQPRTWRSDDGKFSIEATLVEVIDGQAALRRADGRVVKVPLSRLSDADQNYVRNRESGK